MLFVADVVIGNVVLLDQELAEDFQRIVKDNFTEEIHAFESIRFLQIFSNDIEDLNVNWLAR